MLSWIQHLFTARALQAENARLLFELGEARKRISELESQLDVANQVIIVEKEKTQAFVNRHSSTPVEVIPVAHHWPKAGK